MIIAKLSKTIENLTNKKPEVISRDVQTNSNQPTKEPPLWDIMSELSSNSDGIQEEVTKSSNFKQSKTNLKQQLEQVRLQKKIEHNNYQSEQRDKISQDQDIHSPGTCFTMGDSTLIQENLSKDLELLWMISIIMYILSFPKSRNTLLSTREQMMPPVQHLEKF